MIGYDYTERIAPAALKAANCAVVIRYTTWSGWGKSLTPTEADELHAAGIPIAANFESTGNRMLGGAAAGRADALEARGHLGDDHLPASLKVWFSADWDVQPSEVAAVLAYLNAAADALGGQQLVGCYGGLRAARAAADAGFATWQTVAWSGGVWDPRAVMRQTGTEQTVGGVRVDVNEVLDLSALGAWGGPAPTPVSTPIPSSTEDDSMPAFATGVIEPGDGAVTMLCPPPANTGANWGAGWFSVGSDFDGGTPPTVRVAAYVHGTGWIVKENVAVPAAADRVNPFGGPLPTGVQKISVTRQSGPGVPMSYLVEAVAK